MEDLLHKIENLENQLNQVLENQIVMHRILYLISEELSKKGKRNSKTNEELKSSQSIEEREAIFRKNCYDLYSGSLSTSTIKSFCDYWTEHSANSKKMRFEMQKVFDTKRRMSTWLEKSKKIMTPSNGASGFNIAN